MKKMSVMALAILFFISRDVNLTGRWETKPSVNGNVTGIIFKTDKSFEGYVNNKPFFSGIYSVNKDVIKFTDNGCDGAEGVYKVVLFSNNDSMRFEFISDDCVQRREGIKRLVMGRVKNTVQK